MKSNLKTLRMRSRFTLQKLGDLAGLSKSQLHHLETARGNPTLATAYALAKVLDVDVTEIWPNTIKIVEDTITVRRVRRQFDLDE